MRKDHKGFTLVELLIAVTIMTIVIGAVCSFIIIGSKSYAEANNDISVQQEAQLALNQMSDVLIDTTRSINYAGYDASGNPVLVLKDAEFTFEPEGKSLTMYNGEATQKADGTEEIKEGNGNKNYQFYWDKAEETLYYIEVPYTQKDFPDIGQPGWVVLAEHVTEFHADLSQVEEKRVVQLELSFEMGNREYNTSNNITVRNRVLINDAEILPLSKSVEVTVVPKELSVVLEPGEEYHFSTPKVSGKNLLDKTVVWSIEGSGVGTPPSGGSTADGSSFIDASNGIIRIASAETTNSFHVVITTNAKDSEGNHAQATVIVYVKRAHNVNLVKSSDEDTENVSDEVSAGKKFVVSASVTGNKLGVVCDGCSADTTKDWDVVETAGTSGWAILEGAGLVTFESTDAGQATFTVSKDAKKGDVIKIRATSYLSVQRGYGNAGSDNGYVTGVITLTVSEAKTKDLIIDGDIKYGRALKIGIAYPDFNKGGQGYYIICARIKESESAPASSDRIMLYGTNGNDAWMTPDLFGLDVSKQYYVNLQIIDPGIAFSAGDSIVQDVIADYMANCDSTGEYSGKYAHTGMSMYTIYPPAIYYNYKGVVSNGQLTLDTIYATKGYQAINFKVDHVANTIGDPGSGHIAEYVKFRVYRGDGDDPSKWQYIYGYNIQNYYDQNGQWGGERNIGGLSFGEITNATNMYIKLNNYSVMQAVGSYHLVPYVRYINKQQADHSYTVYYCNYESELNYEQVQFYEDTQSMIHFEVKDGNLDLAAYYDNRHFTGTAYFPLPSENDFKNWFTLKQTSLQNKSGNVKMFCSFRGSNGEVCDVYFKKITCEYIAIDDTYVIEFFYNDGQNREYSSGKFVCKSQGTEWERLTAGTYRSN